MSKGVWFPKIMSRNLEVCNKLLLDGEYDPRKCFIRPEPKV